MQKKPKKHKIIAFFSIFILFSVILFASCKSIKDTVSQQPKINQIEPTSPTQTPMPPQKLIEEQQIKIPSGFFPVTDNTGPIAFIPEKNNEAVLFLCTKEKQFTIYTLSRKERIYDIESFADFYAIWLEKGNPPHKIKLGKYPLLYQIQEKTITENAIMYIFSFLTAQKKVDAIISISQQSPPTVNFFDTTPDKSIDIEDYNDDNIPDILVRENLFEQGTGKETFLYLYKWNGHDFEISHSLAVVRSLNNFFYQTVSELQRGDLESFYNRAVEGRPASIWQIFVPEIGTAPKTTGSILITFPPLFENPFPDNARPLSTIKIPVKVEAEGKTFIAHAQLQICKFPFTRKAFLFVIDRNAP
ncbi:hypothetical protein WKV44_01230 [Spirochaetia bacterium 38H-sp]|uniref:Lipoprotein n=1 Tax=Rarispira pelagica TaxID=3141764 RepID=A0ABU9U927_9SPIR